ncbi:GNAT family N-acetyltransferase [Enorma burkinafasonensis]|uniref:GNAT family N-acetyltransferase n=1 Tax=Enorma burkinafasonensis TaxID=2590867 RepID=UPI001FEAB85A|nr:GNAT family N-acetyltransferase [Enorma burkinafasonensis]
MAPTAATAARSLEGGFRIRPIGPADDAAIAAIVRACLSAHGLAIPGTAYFDPELDHLSAYYGERPEERSYFILECPDGSVGGGAGLAEFPGVEGCCELQKIYLIDDLQGRGLGRALLKTVEARARGLGYRRIYLETHHSLATAVGFYGHLGYRRIEQPVPTAHSTMDRFLIKEL